jgi:hypothetical protein
MFAGGNLDGVYYSDVYVLTLPGFHWELAKPALGVHFQRAAGACAVVGQSQFLSFGGLRATQGRSPEDYWLDPDPWTQGIGIFDMSSWSWKARFDADADSYVQHENLRKWYDEGWVNSAKSIFSPSWLQLAPRLTLYRGFNDVEWSKDVKALFVPKNGSDTGGDSGLDENGGNNRELNVGVIAGSIVGGIVLIAAVIVSWLCWRRHQRRKRVAATAQPIGSPPPIESMQPKTGSFHVSHQQTGYIMSPSEIPSESMPSELDSVGRGPCELGGSDGGNRGIYKAK